VRVRAVSMPVRFVRVPIEVMGAADFCSAVSFVARARGASFEGERGGGCRRGEGWVPARARAVLSLTRCRRNPRRDLGVRESSIDAYDL